MGRNCSETAASECMEMKQNWSTLLVKGSRYQHTHPAQGCHPVKASQCYKRKLRKGGKMNIGEGKGNRRFEMCHCVSACEWLTSGRPHHNAPCQGKHTRLSEPRFQMFKPSGLIVALSDSAELVPRGQYYSKHSITTLMGLSDSVIAGCVARSLFVSNA